VFSAIVSAVGSDTQSIFLSDAETALPPGGSEDVAILHSLENELSRDGFLACVRDAFEVGTQNVGGCPGDS
jgi:hypothetical protein